VPSSTLRYRMRLRFAIDLMETDFLAFARRREERNWTGYKRKAQAAFPVRTGGHGTFLANNTQRHVAEDVPVRGRVARQGSPAHSAAVREPAEDEGPS
jgi:hypothetical protein